MSGSPPDLFAFAQARRDAGMAQAEANARPDFSAAAFAAIERVARQQVHVHIDAVLAAMAVTGAPAPHHPNAWGPVWLRAIRSGIIQRTTETRPCQSDPKKNAHRYPVYFSLIFDPRAAEAMS
jgi:hypothetical protein